MKKCTKCKIERELIEFSIDRLKKDGLRSECKSCSKEYSKEYYQANKEHRKEYRKEYRKSNKEKIKERKKEYYEANKEKIKEYYEANKEKIKEHKKEYYKSNKEHKKEYYKSNKEKIKEYSKVNKEKINKQTLEYSNKRRKIDPLFKMTVNLRSRTYSAFKNKGYKKSSKTQEMLGASWEACKAHIEKQFTKDMTLDNQGKWHIDHIVPLASANTEEELITLCNYLNLQPLWAKDNLEKSAKYNEVDKINMIKSIKSVVSL